MVPQRSEVFTEVSQAKILAAFDVVGLQETGVWSGQPTREPVDGQGRTLEEVRSCFQSSSHASIRKLDCRLDDELVVIRGAVSSYYLKQLAQELVRQLGLSQVILNLVTVEEDGKS
jgi:hypothetical protein